ncbi:hypothetical protein R0J87_24845, partial [Halomonas sp. SIMBA_159]
AMIRDHVLLPFADDIAAADAELAPKLDAATIRAIVDLIAERGDDPTQLMLPFRENLDAFRRKTIGARPRETLLAVYIT